eukprot:CAMPEP_0197035294 /NCGR_PEP_ID=MMETSP1384-20130603/13138_1 /TAXON_ID=29189 /ORGANISM="Ammonia sp." /LENGTH=570 /DNA_ID=CAMNT_0042465339 /DNA_START=29 /DNA_END=1741 /DNA_ORIENTATION=-
MALNHVAWTDLDPLEGEGSFNFDAWLNEHDLSAIEPELVKHGLTTLTALSVSSNEFRSLMADANMMTKAYLIPKLYNAISQLPQPNSVNDSPMQQQKQLIITLTEEEHTVLDTIRAKLIQHDELQADIDQLAEALPASQHRVQQTKLAQIQRATAKVHHVFHELENELKEAKLKFLAELQRMQVDISNEAQHNDLELLHSCTRKMNQSKQYLVEQLEACDAKIQNLGNSQRLKRKRDILEIGKQVDAQYHDQHNGALQQIEEICNSTKRVIADNHSAEIEIDFVVDDEKRQSMALDVLCIGHVVHRQKAKLDEIEHVQDDQKQIGAWQRVIEQAGNNGAMPAAVEEEKSAHGKHRRKRGARGKKQKSISPENELANDSPVRPQLKVIANSMASSNGNLSAKSKKKRNKKQLPEVVCTFHPDHRPDSNDLATYFAQFGELTKKIQMEQDPKALPVAKITFKSAESVKKVLVNGVQHNLLSAVHHRRMFFRVFSAEEWRYHQLNEKVRDMIKESGDEDFGEFMLKAASASHCGAKLYKRHDCTKKAYDKFHDVFECTFLHGDEYKVYRKRRK